MAGKAEDRNFGKADEVRVFPKGKREEGRLIRMGILFMCHGMCRIRK
jgi:hypothetical protein